MLLFFCVFGFNFYPRNFQKGIEAGCKAIIKLQNSSIFLMMSG